MVSRFTRWVVALALLAGIAGTAGPAQAVDAPKWVAVLYIEAQKAVGLRWTPVAGATGFKVLRSTTPGAGHVEIASVTAPQHFDKDLEPGTTYYYVLQALAGAETSPNSDERFVAIPGEKKVKAVVPPEWDKLTLAETTEFGKTSFKVGVFWKKNPNPNVVAYNLYKSTVSGKDYQLLTSIPDNKYIDAAVEENKTYYYVVTALDNQFTETPFSPEQKMEVKRTVKAEKKKQAGPAMVTRGTKELFRLPVKGYPGDVQLLPDGELAVACSQLLLFKNPVEGQEPIDISEGWNDFSGVGITNDGELIAVSTGNGIRIYDAAGRVREEYLIPQPEEGAIVDFGEQKRKAKRYYFMDAAQAPDGRFYVTENNNHQVLVLDEDGKFLGQFNAGKEDGYLSNPTHIKVSPKTGYRYIDSFGASAFRIYDDKDVKLRVVGEIGQQVGTFGKIQGIALDAEGNVWVADMQNGNVQVFNPEGEFLFMLADEAETGNMHAALMSGIAVSPDGKRLYAAESMSKTIAVLSVLPPKKQ